MKDKKEPERQMDLVEKLRLACEPEDLGDFDFLLNKANSYDKLYLEAKKLEKAYNTLATQYGILYGTMVLNQTEYNEGQ